MDNRSVTIPYLEKSIEACITTPRGTCKTGYGIILTHGAGGDMHLSQLKLLAEYLGERGITVVRFTCKGLNLAYRVKVYTHVLEYACTQFKDVNRYFLSGRSMGARAAVNVANNVKGTELDKFVAGVIALSYPLHTKDSKSNLRDVPLYELNKPVCFISGADDEMCEQTLFKNVIRKVHDHEIKWIPAADHSMKVKGVKEEDIVDDIGTFIVEWCKKNLNGKGCAAMSEEVADSGTPGKNDTKTMKSLGQDLKRKNSKRKAKEHLEDICRKHRTAKTKK